MKHFVSKHGAVLLKKLILILCVAAFVATGFSYARGKRTVKVAFFPMDGYHIFGDSGTYGGMDVDYLSLLSQYAEWKIEYVVCSSWDDALEKLANHKVDLVGSAQYSESRAEIFDYADLASGYTYGVIATNSDGTIAYEDFDAMKNITFGMVKTYVRRGEFLRYLDDNGIHRPKVIEYETTQDLQNALNNGEVDAMVHTFMEVKEGQRLIGRFAPKPIYYITWKGNDAVLRELNAAIADLKFNHPELETDLMNEYYESRLDKSVLLTTAEQEYLREKQTLVVGYLDGHYPFSYTHSETGVFSGLSREVLENALLWTGVELTYRKFASHEEAHAALRAGEIDIQAYCIQSLDGDSLDNVQELSAYAHLPLVLVTEGNLSLDKVETLATVAGFSAMVEQVVDVSPSSIVIANSQLECMNLLKDGEVHAVLCDGYLAENQLRTVWEYQNLTISRVLSVDHSAHMVIRREEDSFLEQILTKTITSVGVKDINEYMFEENTYPLLNLNTFVRNNSVVIVSVLLGVIAVIILSAAYMLRNSRKIQKLMYKDPAMDIWNMNYLYFVGERWIQADRRMRYAVVSLNTSKLRSYNIIYGWESGQQLLDIIKDTLEKCIDENKEICARNFAGRFVLLLNWADWDFFLERLEKMQQLIETIVFSKTETRMLIPMGVYEVSFQERSLRKAVNCANQAMELAMDGDKYENHIAVYDSNVEVMMTERHQREKLLESVDIGENFVPFYQHKVDIRNGMIVGAEALVRFKDPTANGAIRSPAFFVSYYEQTGRIVELDFHVMESVCKMLRKRMDEGKKVVPVSCNFSRMHFAKPGFVERFEAALNRYRISKDLVEVEITETLVMEELQEKTIKETLGVLKERGIRLSIDDFGAGYSSLGSFVHVPASTIKLDRSFLLNNENPVRQLKIMRGIVRMSEELDAEIVCEGVETLDDLELMKQIEAHVAQGYYYSKPQPQDEFERHLDVQYPV